MIGIIYSKKMRTMFEQIDDNSQNGCDNSDQSQKI